MACKWTINISEDASGKKTLDRNGTKTIESLLYNNIYKTFKSEKKASLLYNKIINIAGDFIQMNGDPYKGIYDEENNPEGYMGSVDVNGEPTIKAALIYYELDRFMREPQNIGEKNPLSKKMAILKTAINSIELQLNSFKKVKGQERMGENLRELKDRLLLELRDKREERGLVRYAQSALDQTKKALELLKELYKNKKDATAIKKTKLTARQLQGLYEYAMSFRNIDDIIIQAEKGYITMEAETLENLKETAKLRDIIEDEYKKISIEFIKDKFAPTNTQAKALFKLNTERKYKEENGIEKGESISEYDKRVKDFVNEATKQAEETGLLLEQAETMLEEQLNSVKGDIDIVQRWMLNAAETDDFILKTVAQEVNSQSDRARLEFQNKAEELHEYWEKLVAYQKEKGVKIKNPLDLYHLILEKQPDGTPTRSYVSQYYSGFYVDMDKHYQISRDLMSEKGESAGRKYWADWKKKYVRVNTEAKKYKTSGGEKAVQKRVQLLAQVVQLDKLIEQLDPESKDYQKKLSDLTDARMKTNQEARKIKTQIDRKLDKLGMRYYIPSASIKSEFLNPQWTELMKLGKEDKNNPIYKFYIKVLETKRISDSRVPESYQLNYKMGGIRKTFWEKAATVKTFTDIWYKVFKPEIKETFSITEEDIELGDVDAKIEEKNKTKEEVVSVNANMEERQFIPLHFRGDPKEQQSYEVMSNLLATYYTATNYHFLNGLLPYIEMLKYHLKERKTTKTRGFKELLARGLTGDPRVSQRGEYSNAYAAFTDYIEQRIYGVQKVDPGWEVGSISFLKGVNAWMTYVGLVTLGGNYLSAKANWNLAQALTWMEGLGSEFYTTKNVAMGEKKYAMDLGNIMNDVGQVRPKSKTNLLGEIFDPLNDFNFRKYNYADNSRWKRLANLSSAHFLNNMAEHNVQNLTMYSILDGTKVMNSKGKYITKAGEETEDINKAMSLDESYTKDNGKLLLNPDVKYIYSPVFGKLKYYVETFSEASRPGDPTPAPIDHRINAQIKLTNAMQQINYDLHGAYSLRNSPPFQRLIIGALALMLRKFLAPSLLRRFGGGAAYLYNKSLSLKGEDKSKYESTKRFRVGTESYTEGMYITSLRTIPNLLKALFADITRMQTDLQRTEWSQLSKTERANIIRTVSELGFGIVMLVFGTIFRGAASDDDDNKYLYYLSFQTNRLYTELFAYVSITEMMRILQSPMATITMVERLKDFIFQLSSDVLWRGGEFEEYQSGKRAGQYKVKKRVMDLVPFWKHGTRHEYLGDIVNYYYK